MSGLSPFLSQNSDTLSCGLIDLSHDTTIKGSKRGQEGMTNEAIFQFRYFFAEMQSFIDFSDRMHRTGNLEKICLKVTVTA